MTHEQGQRPAYWLAIVLVAVAAAGAWTAYLLIQPACGAPGNTALGRSDRWVPWALLVAEMVAATVVSKLMRRRASTIVSGVLFSTVLAATAAVLVFLVWFGSGDCGD
jgi:hypothetical protein